MSFRILKTMQRNIPGNLISYVCMHVYVMCNLDEQSNFYAVL